jgi:hypothetical protein
MKAYRSIDKRIIPNIFIYAFDKLDGSNIRVEWSRKKVSINLVLELDWLTTPTLFLVKYLNW